MNEYRHPCHDPRHSLRPPQRRAIFPLRPSALELPLPPEAYADEPTPLRTAAMVAAAEVLEARDAERNRLRVVKPAPVTTPNPEPPAPRLQSVPVKPSKGGGGRKRGPDGRFLPDA